MGYRAPVSAIEFALMQEAGFQRLINSGKYEDLSDGLRLPFSTKRPN